MRTEQTLISSTVILGDWQSLLQRFVGHWNKSEGLRSLPCNRAVYFVAFCFALAEIFFEKSVTSGDQVLEIQTKVGKRKPGWGKLFVGPEALGHSQGFAIKSATYSSQCLLFGKSCLNKGKLPKKIVY